MFNSIQNSQKPVVQGNVLKFGQATQPRLPETQPNAAAPTFSSSTGISPQQARVLRFSSSITVAPHLQILDKMSKSLNNLNNTNDPQGLKRSVIAEYLGRAQIMNARQALMDLTSPENPVEARISAYKALGNIVGTGNFARVEIGNFAMAAFEERGDNLSEEISQSLESQAKFMEQLEQEPITVEVKQFLALAREQEESMNNLHQEMAAICTVLGETNYADGKTFLKQQYEATQEGIESLSNTLHVLESALTSAQNRYFNTLIQEVNHDSGLLQTLEKMPGDVINSMLANGTSVYLPDGQTMPFKAAFTQYMMMRRSLEVNSQVADSLAEGLTRRPDATDVALIKSIAENSSNPSVTASALKRIAPYHIMEFQQLQRYLKTPSVEVRRAGVKALMYTQEIRGKNKLVELMDPGEFFHTVGSRFNSINELNDTVNMYYQVFSTMVVRGDDFVAPLVDAAFSIDMNLTTRKMAIMALGYMTSKPFSETLQGETVVKAAGALEDLSKGLHDPNLNPTGRSSIEKEEICLTATQMSLLAKNSEAVNSAVNLMINPAYAQGPERKEVLLGALYESMNEDYMKVRQDDPDSPDGISPFNNITLPGEMKRRILSAALEGMPVDEDSPKSAHELKKALTAYCDKLPPTAAEQALFGDVAAKDEQTLSNSHSRRMPKNTEFMTTLKMSMGPKSMLRATLQELLVDPEEQGSLRSRALSARILGLLGDTGSVDKLLDVTKSPFKDKANWSRELSHAGLNTARNSTILRMSTLTALGQIGDARALEPMLNALDDPALLLPVLEGSLALLAPSVNSIGQNRTPVALREALLQIEPDELDNKIKGWFEQSAGLQQVIMPILQQKAQAELQQKIQELAASGEEPTGPIKVALGPDKILDIIIELLADPRGQRMIMSSPIASLVDDPTISSPELESAREKLAQVVADPRNSRLMRHYRLNAAKTLMEFNGGADVLKDFIRTTKDPNAKRHAQSALVSSGYALDPSHPDHELIKSLLEPELGVKDLHEAGITGKGVELAIVDGGYVYSGNKEGFGDRLKLSPDGVRETFHTHPTMVASTAAANGKIVGVAPEATIYSDAAFSTPHHDDHFAPFRRIIEGKLRGENNVRVIQNSWGMVDDNVFTDRDFRKDLKDLKKLLEMAEMANIQIVFSAGNSGEDLYIPGMGTMTSYGVDVDKLTDEDKQDLEYILDKMITVGASNTQGFKSPKKHVLADFSSRGDSLNPRHKPTVVAPGVDMMVYGYDEGKLTKELVNGTSFSGPYTAGLLTLIAQACPDITNDEMRKILTETATQLPNLNEAQQGAGEVVPKKAVKMAQDLSLRRIKA